MAGPAPLVCVVTLPAEIDMANADGVGGQLAEALACGAKVVIADMAATTFCDSIGIRVLVLAHKDAAANGTELRFMQPGPAVVRIMTILGLDTVLHMYPSLAEARAAARHGRSPAVRGVLVRGRRMRGKIGSRLTSQPRSWLAHLRPASGSRIHRSARR